MNVHIYNDGELVFKGALSQFLADNNNDEWLVKECSRLVTEEAILFHEPSGQWNIVRSDALRYYCPFCKELTSAETYIDDSDNLRCVNCGKYVRRNYNG